MTGSERRTAVEEIYATFVSKDLDRVRATAGRWFSPDIVIREPESLPYGGVYEGLETATALFGGLVDPNSPIDAGKLRIDTIVADESSAHVIAAVSFPWHPPGVREALPMRALEWWTFDDEQVTEIQVFLWDVAACLESLGNARVG